jgi:hypothetical protein
MTLLDVPGPRSRMATSGGARPMSKKGKMEKIAKKAAAETVKKAAKKGKKISKQSSVKVDRSDVSLI